jgi:hypothetical protein
LHKIVSIRIEPKASDADFQHIIETLERSASDLGYGSDNVTQRLFPDPPSLTTEQLSRSGEQLSRFLVEQPATPRAKEWATKTLEALANLNEAPGCTVS